MFDIANPSKDRREIETCIISFSILHRCRCLQDLLRVRRIDSNALNRVALYLQQNLDILAFILDVVCTHVFKCLNSISILRPKDYKHLRQTGCFTGIAEGGVALKQIFRMFLGMRSLARR